MDLRIISKSTERANFCSFIQRQRGTTFGGDKIWEPAEDKIIVETAHEVVSVTRELLPHRTERAIEARRVTIGVGGRRLKPWTTHEDRTLRANIGLSYPEMAKFLPNRTVHAIQGRAWYLGIRKGCRRAPRPTGLLVYDMVRNRAFEDGLSMHALDSELRTGKYFQDNYKRTLNWKKLASAVDFFGGQMNIDWQDV